MALRQQQNIGIEKMQRFDTIQAAGIAAICLILENSLQPVRRPTLIIEEKNYACDANSREIKY
jgi:hypothetical protein